jgi:UDP-N-acetylmuramoyl-L-alanyl-D-glutamate--2,6-diaminopimelate ligase
MKKLSELFEIDKKEDMNIYSIHSDSRWVRPNSIFFCIEGLSVDGHRYVDDAIFQGAKCIVYSKELHDYQQGVVYIRVKDTLDELNRVSNVFYDYPSKKIKMLGVTGTSGKTVVASMIKNAMNNYCPTGFIGTISVEYPGVSRRTPYTTPETIYVQQTLASMAKKGVKVCTMEASSHGLALRRIDAINFAVAIMTNIGSEHLDFHGTVEQYVLSKRKLFEMVPVNGTAILNNDDHNFGTIRKACVCKVITYGIDNDSDIMAKNIKLYIDHTELDLYFKCNLHHVILPTIGMFNIYNVLAVVGGFIALGFDDQMIIKEVENLAPIPGRCEVLKTNDNVNIIIDYCQHTENYENILKFVTEAKDPRGKVIVVMGAPGKRNLKRRKKIGKIADKYADHIIITELDERGEDLDIIAKEISSEIKNTPYVTISSREVAVEQAVEMANENDVVLLLGKGNEDFISLPVGQIPYLSDRTVALNTIENKFGEDYEEIQ